MTIYKWQEPYQAALLELDPERLKGKIAIAETAIFQRYQELADDSDHSDERTSLEDARNALRVLQTDRLGYSRSPTESKFSFASREG